EPTARLAVKGEQFLQAGVRLLLAAALVWLAWRFAPTVAKGSKADAVKFLSAVFIAAATYFVTDFAKVFYVPTVERTKGELKPELFSHKFSDMISDLRKSMRLIVVIDNLDRCSADRIEEVFFTLSTFLEPISMPKNERRLAIGKDRPGTKDAVF